MSRRKQKRITLLVGVPVVLAVAVGSAYAFKEVHRNRKMDVSLREGTAAYEAGDYPGTMDKLGYYISQNRKDPKALLMIANARKSVPLENRRHIAEAIPYAKLASEAAPDDVAALELLLDLYSQANYRTEALQTADRLLKITPAHNEALRVKAFLLASTGKWPEAIEVAKKRAAAYPDDVDANKDLVGMMASGNVSKDEIAAFADSLAAGKPDEPRYVVMQAAVYAHKNENAKAVILAKKAAAMPMTSPRAAEEVLALLDLFSNIDSTLHPLGDELLQRELQCKFSQDIAVVAAQRSWKHGNTTAALQSIAKACDPTNLKAAKDNALGWAAYFQLVSGKKLDSAEVAPLTAELKARSTKEALYWGEILEAQSLVTAGKPQDARPHLVAARGYAPQSDLAEFIEGDVDQRVGEWRQAAARLKLLVRDQPTWRVARVTLVNILLMNGDVNQAVAEAEGAIKARQGPAEYTMLARAYTRLVEGDQGSTDKIERITRFADQIVASDSKDLELKALAARIYLAVNRQGEAETIVRSLLEASPPPESSVLSALSAALRRRNPALSEQVLARAAADAETPELALQSALQLADNGQREQGRALLERSIQRNKGSREVEYTVRLAMYLDYLNDPGALALYTRLADENPSTAWVQAALLDSQCAWKDEQTVTTAIERLRNVTGKGGSGWKLQEARRLLTFNPSQQRASQVVQLVAEVLKTDPRNLMGLALYAEAQILLGDRNSAIELLAQAVDADADRPMFYPRLVELLQQSGRTEEAARRLLPFTKVPRPTPEMIRRRARLLSAQGMWDHALADYSQLIKSGSVEDRYSYAAVLYRKGDVNAARAVLDELAAAKDLSELVVIQIADFYASQGDFDKGRQVLEQKLPATSNANRSLILATFFDRHKHPELAEQQYIEQAKDNKAESVAELAAFYFKQRRLADAQKALDRGLAIDANNPRLRQIKGFMALGQGEGANNAQVMAEIVDAMNNANADPALRRLAQAIQEFEQDPRQVAEWVAKLEALTRDHPAFFPGWRFLVQARMQRGQVREAVDASRAALKAMPIDPRPAQLATEVLVEARMLDEALVTADAWGQRLGAESYEPDMVRGAILAMLGRYPEALQKMDRWRNRIISEADKNPGPLGQYAEVLAAVGREADAKSLIWPRIDTGEAWALTALRVAEKLEGKQQTEWLGRIEPILLTQNTTRVELGRVLYSAGSKRSDKAAFAKAVEVMRPALDDTRTRTPAALYSAGCEEGRGNRAEAIRLYRVAMEQLPNDPPLLNNLAYLLCDSPDTVGEAVKLSARAVELSERSVAGPQLRKAFLETHGVCLLRANQAKDAESAFRKAIDLDPSGIEAGVGLAEALVAQERGTEARPILDRIESSPNKPTDAKVLERIKALRAKLG